MNLYFKSMPFMFHLKRHNWFIYSVISRLFLHLTSAVCNPPIQTPAIRWAYLFENIPMFLPSLSFLQSVIIVFFLIHQFNVQGASTTANSLAIHFYFHHPLIIISSFFCPSETYPKGCCQIQPASSSCLHAKLFLPSLFYGENEGRGMASWEILLLLLLNLSLGRFKNHNLCR